MNLKEQNFSLFDFSNTHSQLLFRAVHNLHNIDLLFTGVFFYHGPFYFLKCDFSIAEETEAHEYKIKAGLEKLYRSQKFFVIKKNNVVQNFIGATGLFYQKNNLIGTSIAIKMEREEWEVDVNDERFLEISLKIKNGEFTPEPKGEPWIKLF